MRRIRFAVLMLALAPCVGFGQNDHSQDKSSEPAGGMTMCPMMAGHEEMSQLMSKMMQSMEAINNEKDPTKLKALLANT